ncbi:MAG: hypothetical protein QOD41_29 [Cryptosporangiaceae bacterium]|nr:hypothetical protein [Cryptosporangiaceae bacterium]
MRLLLSRAVRSGVSPVWLVTVLAAGALLVFQTPVIDLVKYAAYVLYAVAVPGVLVWRSLRGAARSLAEDLAAGVTLGFALEILVYIGLRAAGAPILIVVYPAVVIAVFAGVPALRRHWRSGDAPSAPWWWSWSMAGIVAVVLGYIVLSFFRTHPLTGPIAAFPYSDMPYNLSIAAELKQRIPPSVSYVLGEPLHYHWFSHADMAATSWGTGIELRTLQLRLTPLPFIVLNVLFTGLLAVRLSRRWWTGPVAVGIAYFVSAYSPFSFAGRLFSDERMLSPFQWESATQVAASALLAPALLLLVDRFRGEPGARGQWALIGILLVAAMGAKSTVLILVAAGFVVALVYRLLLRRELNRTALIGAITAGALFVFATVVLYGGDSSGMTLDPLGPFSAGDAYRILGIAGPGPLSAMSPSLAITIVMVTVTLTSWLIKYAGIAGLYARRKPPETEVVFLSGMVLAAIAIVILFRHPGSSQLYFIRSVLPITGALTAAGLAAALPAGRRTTVTLGALGVASLTGAFAVELITNSGMSQLPTKATLGTNAGIALELAKSMIAPIIIVALLAALVWWLAASHLLRLRGMTMVLLLGSFAGFGFHTGLLGLHKLTVSVENYGIGPLKPGHALPIPAGGLEASRWLRDHSSTSDVVATNAHCYYKYKGHCDNRHFWIAAYTERQVLIEGWGYTSHMLTGGWYYSKYWNPARLADNDRAFTRPSPGTIGLLAAKYGVRWLVVDELNQPASPQLGQFAALRYHNGQTAIYELPPRGSATPITPVSTGMR